MAASMALSVRAAGQRWQRHHTGITLRKAR
jgi:hypothetical protein